MRSVPEWVAKTHDTAIPARVKVRVFEKYKGICYLSGRKILAGDKWEVEHIIALANGGEHRENNLAPALVEPHKEKTKADRKITAKINRVRKKHLGLDQARGKPILGSKKSGWKRKMDGTVVRR